MMSSGKSRLTIKNETLDFRNSIFKRQPFYYFYKPFYYKSTFKKTFFEHLFFSFTHNDNAY
jgi:hypothetical protein